MSIHEALTSSSPLSSIRILSPEHPWTIEISRNNGEPLTPLDVIGGLYRALQIPLTWKEWKLASERQKAVMARSVKSKASVGSDAGQPSEKVRRVDWLGQKTSLVGLRRDDKLAAELLGSIDESSKNPTFIAIIADC